MEFYPLWVMQVLYHQPYWGAGDLPLHGQRLAIDAELLRSGARAGLLNHQGCGSTLVNIRV